jgi:hypothetical protein
MKQPLILSGTAAKRSVADAQSKDPNTVRTAKPHSAFRPQLCTRGAGALARD